MLGIFVLFVIPITCYIMTWASYKILILMSIVGVPYMYLLHFRFFKVHFTKSLGVVGGATAAVITYEDGETNGWKPHHTADLVLTGIAIGLMFTPAAPAAAFFAGYATLDLTLQITTNKSATELIFDP